MKAQRALAKIFFFFIIIIFLLFLGKSLFDQRVTIEKTVQSLRPTPTPVITLAPTATPTLTPTPAPITPNFIAPGISWNVSPQTITNDELLQIPAVQIAIKNKLITPNDPQIYTSIQYITFSDRWLKANIAPYAADTNLPIGTGRSILIGQKLSTGWVVHVPGESDFCSVAKQVPLDILAPADRNAYCK